MSEHLIVRVEVTNHTDKVVKLEPQFHRLFKKEELEPGRHMIRFPVSNNYWAHQVSLCEKIHEELDFNTKAQCFEEY